jgi:hypothetical protein
MRCGGGAGFVHHREAGFARRTAFVKLALKYRGTGFQEKSAIALMLAVRAQTLKDALFHLHPDPVIFFFHVLFDAIGDFEFFGCHFRAPSLIGFFVGEAVRLATKLSIAGAVPKSPAGFQASPWRGQAIGLTFIFHRSGSPASCFSSAYHGGFAWGDSPQRRISHRLSSLGTRRHSPPGSRRRRPRPVADETFPCLGLLPGTRLALSDTGGV